MPSSEFTEAAQVFENCFKKFHGETVNMTSKPIEKLTNFIVRRFPTYPKDVLKLFSKTRFFIRMKYLNEKLEVKEKHLRSRFSNHINKFK